MTKINTECFVVYAKHSVFTFVQNRENKKYVGPLLTQSSVTIIDVNAFSNCRGLTSVTIPNSVTQIYYAAFYGCSGLTSVTIPDGVAHIGDSAFDGCSGLTSVTIPDSVTSIGKAAFDGCSGLTSVSIPKSVTKIDNNAFRYCNNISTVYYNGTDDEWDEICIYTGNEALTNATRKTIYYITLIDDGNTSSITCLPNEKIKLSDIEKKYMHKVTLYTDEAMTKEFDTATEITDNMTLYVKLGEEITVIYGDIDDDGEITMNDAIYLFNAAMFPDKYPISAGQKTDYNGDGKFDMNDAIYLFNHAMFPEQYPI